MSNTNLLGKFLSLVWALVVLTMPAFAQTTPDWQLVWSDEFSGTAGSPPNPQNWTLTQGLTPDGAQSYNCLFGQATNGCDPNNPNVFLDGNGNLAIVARAAAGAPNGVTTGRLSTTAGSNNSTILFGTQYGRIEAGITLPVNAGNQGVWPAFWMLGNNISSVSWPSSGEIDIMEYIGQRNLTQIFGTIHGQGYADTGLGNRATNPAGWSGYHVFGILWSPNLVQFYVDDISNIYFSITPADLMANQSWLSAGLSAWPFNNPFFILLDLNMGGPFPGNVSSATTFPQTLLVDYVRVYQATSPAPPTDVAVTATSQSQVALNWTASTTANVTYNVYRSSLPGVAPLAQTPPAAVVPKSNQTLIANNITGTSYYDANLAPGRTYYYTVTSSGLYSSEAAATQVPVTMPTSGVGSNGGEIHVSAGGYSGTGQYIQNSLVNGGFTNAFTNTFDTAQVTDPAPRDVYHSERWGPQTWTIAHLTPGGSYDLRMHFAESAFAGVGQRQFNVLVNGTQVLTNFDILAAAGAQNTVVTQTVNVVADQNGVIYLQLATGAADQPEIRALDVTPSSSGAILGGSGGGTSYVAINSGGPQESLFAADTNETSGSAQNPLTAGGGTNSTTQTINLANVFNPAPSAVYQTERFGAFGYVFTGLVPNTAYTVRLHFAEAVANFNTPGARLFNVSLNGTQVLTNYDIFATAGAINQALIQELPATSNEHGILSVQLLPGANDLPTLRGIEILEVGTIPPVGPPTGLTAVAVSSSQVNLTWSPSSPPGVQYQVFRGTTPGFTPSSSNQIGSTSNLAFSDTGLSPTTVYYYVITASNATQTSVASPQVIITTFSIIGTGDILAINVGGAAAGNYLADEDFVGGTVSTTTASINTSLVPNPAPVAVYQTGRTGNFTYTIPKLIPGSVYDVNLHFAEIFFNAAGRREFNVLINGTQVLTNFDVFAAAGGEDVAIVKSFPTPADSTGTITIQFKAGAVDQPKVSAIELTQVLPIPVIHLQINAGGAANGTWVADEDFTGGSISTTTAAVNTSLIANPAPAAVYQTGRLGKSTYTIPNLTAGVTYNVNLHFAETSFSSAGSREFNVLINGTQVLTNFDVFAAAGGKDTAVVKSFSATAANNGTITLQFANGSKDQAKINGIEVISQ